MSDSTANTDTATTGEATTGQSQEAASEPITTQEDLNQLEQTRMTRERSKYTDDEQLKACAAKQDEVEESSKSEIQKVIERADKVERKLQAKATEVERLRVIVKHSIPQEHHELITASDAEGMESQAVKLKPLIRPKGPVVSTEGKQPTQTPGASDWLSDILQHK